MMIVENSCVSDGANDLIDQKRPYTVNFTLEGISDMLFHKWNAEAVEEKAKAKKGSSIKTTDNIESYVYRDENGQLCIPSEYVRQSIIKAAKFKKDPRSPRKSAMDLYKASLIPEQVLATLGIDEWHYLHKGRVVVQQNAINRTRPAVFKGWKASFSFTIITPEHIPIDEFIDTLTIAGKLVGLADFRPTYGKFVIKSWEVL